MAAPKLTAQTFQLRLSGLQALHMTGPVPLRRLPGRGNIAPPRRASRRFVAGDSSQFFAYDIVAQN